jgi:3-oxoacyl-[acyl-carrier-protein] synthase II
LITSNKGHIGHCFSAAGLIESVLGLEGMKKNVLLPTFGFERFDEFKIDEDLREIEEYVEISSEMRELPADLNFLLKNSFGFGGVNNSLLFRKHLS